MFEAFFKTSVLVESDEQGQCSFKIYEGKEPLNEYEFLSLIKAVYQQQVAQMLQVGDELTLLLHVNMPNHELEKMVRVREDRCFEADWLPEPTADLLPIVTSIYEHFRRQIIPGNVFTITFHIQRF
jgi:hypothetical protein